MNKLINFNLLLVVLIINLLTLTTVQSGRSNRLNKNEIMNKLQNAHVEAYTPNGFKVSLVDFYGLQKFRFSGNINGPIDKTENATITRLICEPVDGKWTFFDNHKLRVGDALNFWIEVLVDGTIYRSDSLNCIIRDLKQKPYESDQLSEKIIGNNASTEIKTSLHPLENGGYTYHLEVTSTLLPSRTESSTTTKTTTSSNKDQNADIEITTLQSILNMTTSELNQLREKVKLLENQLATLKEVYERPSVMVSTTTPKTVGTRLLLTGDQPPKINLLETIRQLIVEKLNLRDFETKILQAYQTDDGIMFEVPTSADKQRILNTAAIRLLESPYQIEDPEIMTRSRSLQFQKPPNNYRKI